MRCPLALLAIARDTVPAASIAREVGSGTEWSVPTIDARPPEASTWICPGTEALRSPQGKSVPAEGGGRGPPKLTGGTIWSIAALRTEG